MPLYEYECEACGERFEVIRKFSDPPLEACKKCGRGPIRRLPSSPAIQFKGTGWYITDYAQKGKSDSSGTSPTKDAKDSKDSKKDTPATGTESAAKSGSESTTTTSDTSTSSTPSSTPTKNGPSKD